MTRAIILELFRWLWMDWTGAFHAAVDATNECSVHRSGRLTCSYPVADWDHDRDTDLRDFAAWSNTLYHRYPTVQSCMGGPGKRTIPRCTIFDADRDGDVDLRDLAL